ncbi:hypothetical protein BJX70DRAFT_386546 [Aspergillus crustosus]
MPSIDWGAYWSRKRAHGPTQELLCCYQSLWRQLPEQARDGNNPTWNSVIENILTLIDPESTEQISYSRLREFVEAFDLGLNCSAIKPRVVVVLPNGPYLALAALAVANRYTLIPMASTVAREQLEKDILAVNADAILILDKDVQNLGLKLPDSFIFTVRPQDNLTFSVSCVNRSHGPTCARAAPNKPDDLAMILFTSGTSGNKKLVPITMMNLLSSAIFTRESLGLDSSSRSICCSSFDPSIFWNEVQSWQPTWYYATPTMHQMILAQAEHNKHAVQQNSINFICNAGGGIPPTLATQLQTTFKCKVFPSYGMIECAPIAAPPLNYRLERVRSSWVTAGPDLAIVDINQTTQRSSVGTIGRVCVRGLPVFPGYLTSQGLDRSGFDALGWFDTGDLGYVDEAGYLYITGRSKEVINRGGEIISPLEVEDAILSAAEDKSCILFGRIAEVLAFSTPHEVLQEVVGVVIVTTSGQKRPDLRQIQEGLKGRLEQPKWPGTVVYMDQLPKIGSKLCRIRLSDQLGLATLTDKTPMAECHYEGQFPPSEGSLRQCRIDTHLAEAGMKQASGVSDDLVRVNQLDGFLQAIIFRGSDSISVDKLLANLRTLVDGYLVPSTVKILDRPMPKDAHGMVDHAAVDAAIEKMNTSSLSPTERRVCEVFLEMMECPADEITSSTDFFTSGGDSMSAGRLVSRIRQEFCIHLAADVIFRHSTVSEISHLIDKSYYPGCSETYSSTNPIVLVLNLLPIGIFHPMLLSLRWVLFIYLMAETSSRWPAHGALFGRLVHISLIGLATRLFMSIFRPLLGIAFKWLVIGRYRAGMYPMWGPYHMRWWLTQKALQVYGKGIYNEYYWTRVLYYRALGARIGYNVWLHENISLGEYDLIEIGDNATLEHCVCRPFGPERNTSTLLQPIRISANCTVGLRAVIAPGARLFPGTCLGPNTSSWELDDAQEYNRELAPSRIPKPHWIWYPLLIEPLRVFVSFGEALPTLFATLLILRQSPDTSEHDLLSRQIFWFADPNRIGYYLLSNGLDMLCGRPQRGPYKRMSNRQKLRSAVLDRVFPQGDLSRMTNILGTHYEPFSVIVRMLGARVGKRVYWPIVGLTMIEDYDMLEVGNDVVFGSRSSTMTADGIGREPVIIGDGAFVGDRVVALPGTTIGKRTTVGSGALLRRDGFYPDDTAWAGSRHGDAIQFPHLKPRSGKIQSESDTSDSDSDYTPGADTITPFGRAFYEGQADYHVLGMCTIIAYSTLITAIQAIYPTFGPLTGLTVVLAVAILTLLQTLAVLFLTITAKWSLLGHRKQGYYPWHRSSYSQRWQITLTIERLIDHYPANIGILTLLSGTAFLLLFYRAMGATVGAHCALAADGQPDILWTEPDLVTFGDRVTGEFELHELRVGDRSVLRSGSRLLAGAEMGAGACLMEHTLVLSGDCVEDGGVVQGWPCEAFEGDRVGGLGG